MKLKLLSHNKTVNLTLFLYYIIKYKNMAK